MPGSFLTSFLLWCPGYSTIVCSGRTDVLTSGMHEHLFNIMLATIVLSASWIWQKGGEVCWEVPSKSRFLRLLRSLASCCFVQCVHFASVEVKGILESLRFAFDHSRVLLVWFLAVLGLHFLDPGWSLLSPWSCTGWDTRWGYQRFLGVLI